MAKQERQAQEHVKRLAAEQAEQERPPMRGILTSVTPANQDTVAKPTRKERSPRRATQVDFAAAQQPTESGVLATRQIPNPRPLEAISEDVAPQIHGSTADIPVTERNEDVSQPPPLTKGGNSSQEEHALLANREERAE